MLYIEAKKLNLIKHLRNILISDVGNERTIEQECTWFLILKNKPKR